MRAQHNIVRGVAAGAALLTAAFPSAAWAGNASTNLSVTATVTDNCTVSSAPVAFGSVDVMSGANVDATGSVSVTCTNGTAWAAAAGAGAGAGASLAVRKMKSGGNMLNYNLYTNEARTTVWGDGTGSTATVSNTGSGAPQSFTVYGRVPTGQGTAAVGSYSDTVAVTVSY